MTDYYLKAVDESEMYSILISAGLAVQETYYVQVGVDENGDPIMGENTMVVPVPYVYLDLIGPFSQWDYSVEPPVEINYPEWYANMRCGELTEEQLAIITPAIVHPVPPPYRVWA